MAKILLVEDDNNLREIYEARLQAEGYDIVAAKDGEEALSVAKKEQPDLIISDVMMPRISGFEMLDILRNTEGLKDVKVIMLTALGQAEDKTRADSLGADRYLVKSQVTLEDIVKSASDLLAGIPAGAAASAAAAAEAAAASAPVAIVPAVPVAPAPAMPVATAPAEPAAPAPVAPAPVAPVATPPVVTPPVAPVAPAPTPAVTLAPTPAVPAPAPPVIPTPEPQPQAVPPMPPIVEPAPAPAPQTPPEPVAVPAPAAPAPEPAEPTPAAPQMPVETAPEAASIAAPAAEEQVNASAPQDTSSEQAVVQAQIDKFAATPVAPAPEPAPAMAPEETPAAESASGDDIMADAVKGLVDGSPQASPTVITPDAHVVVPAPATPAGTLAPTTVSPTMPHKPSAPEDDSVTISKKKIISPLAAGTVQERPDLHALLAKEGENLDEPAQPTPSGLAAPPHPPGHVISPTPTNAAGQPIDPNSISL